MADKVSTAEAWSEATRVAQFLGFCRIKLAISSGSSSIPGFSDFSPVWQSGGQASSEDLWLRA
jgi:hypothetical protein